MVTSGIANMFRIPELRKRLLFTLGILAVYRLGIFVTTPGRRPRGDAAGGGELGRPARPLQPVLGRRARAALDLRARDHAVHLGVHHPAAPHGRRPGPREDAEGGRDGPAQDHAVHALRHHRAVGHPGLRHLHLPRVAARQHRGCMVVGQPGLGLPAHDRHLARRRHRLHHVDGRADHRARRRQRHLAHHLRRHRGPHPGRHLPDLRGLPHPGRRARRVQGHRRCCAAHDRDGRRHRLLRARPAPDPRAVREAGGGPEALRRPVHAPAAQGEHLGRHPAHLRLLDPALPGHARAPGSRSCRVLSDEIRPRRPGSTTPSTSRSSSSSPTSTRR